MTTSAVEARGGGVHGGGVHGGGFHSGGFHGAGHISSFHGGWHGGWHGWYGGYGRGYGYRYWGGYGPYRGGYYPYYGSYPYYGYNPYLDGGINPLLNAYADDTTRLPSSLTSAAAPIDNTAHIIVRVPADAQIWVQGTKTDATGTVRELVTPPLTRGGQYEYDIKARWKENGHEVTQAQRVVVTAGAHFNVTFPTTAQTALNQP
jgi:uncharacterized protein (TIGR03000 family)